MSVTKVLLDILVVLFAAKMAAEVAERVGLPAVVGEIIAGILIGPSALGLVGGDEVLRTLAELGVILLLFDVGLEMDLTELAAVGRASMAVATVGVVVPFITGYGVGLALGMDGTEALFIGAALTATSVGITARVFGDLRALGTVEARTVLGAAVADDVMGLIILTVVVRVATTGSVSLGRVGTVVAVAVAFLVVTTAVGIRIAPSVFAFVARVSRSSGTLVALALAFALACAELANAAKLAPIVGAFVAGVCLGRSPAAGRVRRELTPVGHLFIPVFFLQVGIDAEIGQFAHAKVIATAAALLVVAVAGKIVSAVGLGRAPGDRLLVGIGMIPRGEVGLIFATIGLREHVFGEDVYGSLLLVVLATTLMTPPILRWLLLRRRARAAGAGGSAVEPPGGWLQVGAERGATVELHGDPPPQLALEIGLQAALLVATHPPGSRLLDWLSSLPDQPLRWTAPARANLFEVLENGGPRTWRFLSLTGLLDRALPELGQALARRQADPFELDPTGALRWHRLSRVLELDERHVLRRPEILSLAAIILDAGEGGEIPASIVTARRIAKRLDLGAAAEESLAGLVAESELLVPAARRFGAFAEENVLTVAVHLGSPDQARALYLLTLASMSEDDRTDRQRIEELHRLVQDALAQPQLTGREASNAVSQRRAEASRLTADAAVLDRIAAAPRAYVLATPADELARHAALCEPPLLGTDVRVAVTPAGSGPGAWTVDFVARDRVGLLARETRVLAEAGLDVRQATLATWGDNLALSSFGVDGDEPQTAALRTSLMASPSRSTPVALADVKVRFDHQGSPWHSLCRVEGPDRPGLLHALAVAFAAVGVNVHAARITGRDGVALDEFELTGPDGAKLDGRAEEAIVAALAQGPRRRGRFGRRGRAFQPDRQEPVVGNGHGAEFMERKQTSDGHETARP
ncbi:MAG: cation:proton antiporter [Actinobacteria bacterium]|nr:cation:proton antiporter [Actinomycetota bacterium]